jgi:hypothetical protein
VSTGKTIGIAQEMQGFQMRRKLLGIITFAILAACSTPRTAVGPPNASGVTSIKPGMTQPQVAAILGDFQREDFDPSNGISSCRSYAYGASPERKYVHVYFYEEIVEAATDGHIGLCIYRGDIIG